ncbi:MAG: XRE family transcriptional regulator [Candidatus Omnitrophota bacterium]
MKIGKRLKELRKEQNMTLEELSKKSGVALATLSRIENNKMTGTLVSHNRLCKALGTSLVELYGELEDEAKVIETVPRRKRTEHFIHAQKAKYELLVTKTLDKKIMPLMMVLGKGGETQKEKNKPGIEKFIYVMTGVIEANVGGQNYALKKGDSLYFDASLPHFFKNKTKTEAEAICVISPPAL